MTARGGLEPHWSIRQLIPPDDQKLFELGSDDEKSRSLWSFFCAPG